MQDPRNYSIDLLKLLCAFMVVVIHADWTYKQAVMPIMRVAVPCFFIISGYFICLDNNKIDERLSRSIWSIFKILIWSTLLFAVIREVVALYGHGTFFVPSVHDIAIFIIFNENPFAGHLWYIGAYLYVLLAIKLVNKLNLWKFLFCITPILLLCDLAFGKYSFLLFNKGFEYYYSRNFLFVGIPYFSIGAYLQKKNICNALSDKQLFLMGGGDSIFSNFVHRKKFSAVTRFCICA